MTLWYFAVPGALTYAATPEWVKRLVERIECRIFVYCRTRQ